MGYPINSGLRGLARVTFISEIEPWDFDLPMVPSGTDPVAVSDWHLEEAQAMAQESLALLTERQRANGTGNRLTCNNPLTPSAQQGTRAGQMRHTVRPWVSVAVTR